MLVNRRRDAAIRNPAQDGTLAVQPDVAARQQRGRARIKMRTLSTLATLVRLPRVKKRVKKGSASEVSPRITVKAVEH